MTSKADVRQALLRAWEADRDFYGRWHAWAQNPGAARPTEVMSRGEQLIESAWEELEARGIDGRVFRGRILTVANCPKGHLLGAAQYTQFGPFLYGLTIEPPRGRHKFPNLRERHELERAFGRTATPIRRDPATGEDDYGRTLRPPSELLWWPAKDFGEYEDLDLWCRCGRSSVSLNAAEKAASKGLGRRNPVVSSRDGHSAAVG